MNTYSKVKRRERRGGESGAGEGERPRKKKSHTRGAVGGLNTRSCDSRSEAAVSLGGGQVTTSGANSRTKPPHGEG